jgi:hypothetical protein
MEEYIKIRGVQKWVQKYLFQTPETQYMKDYKEECAGARVSGNKSGNNCSGLQRHRNTWKGA